MGVKPNRAENESSPHVPQHAPKEATSNAAVDKVNNKQSEVNEYGKKLAVHKNDNVMPTKKILTPSVKAQSS